MTSQPDDVSPAEPMQGALRAAFRPMAESVLGRLHRQAGVKSRIHLPEEPGDEPPLLSLPPGGPDAQDDSRYGITGEIAKGGVGIVYQARDRNLGREVALKVLRPEHARNAQALERLVEEAQIGGQLQHPGIVPIYGLGIQPDGRPYFAMKLIKGRTFAALLADRRSPDENLPELLRIFEQMCQAMAYTHSRGVIHRDLKPSNVMVGGAGEVQVVDWGFGKVLGRTDPLAPRPASATVVATLRSAGEGSNSIVGSVMGTPAYMPPEQALGRIDALDERCDVFALGAILCEILTGKPPYVGAPEDLLTKAAQGRLDEATERLEATDADPDLVALCLRALSPMRGDRIRHAGEICRVLEGHFTAAEERARAAEVHAVEEQARLERERRAAVWERRAKRRARLLSAALVIAVGAVGGTWIWRERAAASRADRLHPDVHAALDEASHAAGGKDWARAEAAALRAEALAGESPLLADERNRAASLARQASAEAERAARRRLLLDGLQRAFDLVWNGAGRQVEADDAHLEAYRSAGIDVESTPPQTVAELVQAEFPDLSARIRRDLDEWGRLRLAIVDMERDASIPFALAGALDDDAWRRGFRAAALADDRVTLRALPTEGRDDEDKLLLASVLGAGDQADKRQALVTLRELSARHLGDFRVRYRTGSVAAWLEGDDQARDDGIEELSAALALRPACVPARLMLVDVLVAAGEMEGAVEHAREAVRLWPGSARSLLTLAHALEESGDFVGARHVAREAAQLDPASYSAQHHLARIAMRLGENEEAIARCRAVLGLKPDYGPAHMNIALVLYRSGDFAGAALEASEAARLMPAYQDAWAITLLSQLELGQFDAAARTLERAREHVGGDERWGLLVESVGRRQKLADDLSEALAAVAADPRSVALA